MLAHKKNWSMSSYDFEPNPYNNCPTTPPSVHRETLQGSSGFGLLYSHFLSEKERKSAQLGSVKSAENCVTGVGINRGALVFSWTVSTITRVCGSYNLLKFRWFDFRYDH